MWRWVEGTKSGACRVPLSSYLLWTAIVRGNKEKPLNPIPAPALVGLCARRNVGSLPSLHGPTILFLAIHPLYGPFCILPLSTGPSFIWPSPLTKRSRNFDRQDHGPSCTSRAFDLVRSCSCSFRCAIDERARQLLEKRTKRTTQKFSQKKPLVMTCSEAEHISAIAVQVFLFLTHGPFLGRRRVTVAARDDGARPLEISNN